MAIRARSDNLSLDHPEATASGTGPVSVAPVHEFSELWAHREALRRACYRMVGNAATAEDLVQDTYLRALKSDARFEGRKSMAPWLNTVARRRTIDELRSRRRLSVLAELPEPSPRLSDDPAQQVVNHETVERLRAALGELSPRERQLLLRQVSHGLSLAELAADESTSVASVRSVLARARQKLRMSLERGGALGALPLPRIVAGWRNRLQRWAVQGEGALPLVTGAGWQLGQLVAAVVIALAAVLVGASTPPLPIANLSSLATSIHAAGEFGSTRAPAYGADHNGGTTGGTAASAGSTSPPGSSPLPPVPSVGLPDFPSEGVDQPEQSRITHLAASADGSVIFAVAGSGTTGLPLLYRSLDGGASWQRVGTDAADDGQKHRSFLGGTVVVPPTYATDGRVFAAGLAGLQRSTDGGRTWAVAAPAQGQAVISPHFESGDETVYVSGPPPSAYTDDSRHLQPLGTVPPSVARGGIAIGPAFASTGEILVGGTSGPTGKTPAVFTCTAAGCMLRSSVPSLAAGPDVLVSATDPDVVFAWNTYALARSTDGGYSFTAHPIPSGFNFTRMVQGDGRLYLLGRDTTGTLPGVLASDDEGNTWIPLGGATALARGATTLVSLPGGRLVAAPYASQGLLCSSDHGLTWAARCVA